MSVKYLKSLIFLCAALLLSPLHAIAQTANSSLQPTEVVYYSLKAMAENPTANRIATIKQFFERLETENLSQEQEFALGEVYFLNFKPRESYAQYEPFMSGNDMRARIAWQKTMQINFAGFRRHELVEEMIEDYWEKFEPIRADIWDTSRQIRNLAYKYQNEGDYQKAVDLITREIERLPRNAPYRAFRLPVVFMKSFEAVGQREEALELIQSIRGKMREDLARFAKQNPDGTMIFKEVNLSPGTYYRLEEGLEGAPFSGQYPLPSLRIRQYMQLINELGIYR